MNLGIATALNQGMDWAKAHGFQWVLTLDQDTLVHENLMVALTEIYQRCGTKADIALIGSGYDNANVGAPDQMVRTDTPGTWREVTVNITSGSLISLRVYTIVGRFREDFFIDCVDQEFCLRARALGYRIWVSDMPLMTHALGDYAEKRIFGYRFAYTNHPPVRRYYSSRNRMVLMKSYFFMEPIWVMDLLRRFMQDIILILLFEDAKYRKLRAICMGVADFFMGRMGRFREHVENNKSVYTDANCTR